jgi:cytochrome c oxidase assembly protein subunit 15
MVDQKGFRAPWHLFAVLQEQAERGETPNLGLVIEYSHRLAGFVVGICVIVLAAGLWFRARRPWLRWVGVAALVGVVAQGLLGIFRVNLNALMGHDLALVHGCFAQLVFALLVSVALFTSRGWSTPAPAPRDGNEALRLRRWALATAVLVYLQIVVGAVMRQWDPTANPSVQLLVAARVHLLLAFAVVAATLWLAKLVADAQPRTRGLTRAAAFLVGLVVLQLLLGVESWLARFPLPVSSRAAAAADPVVLRSLHYLVGSLIFAGTVVVTLQAYRRTMPATQPETAPVGRLEGAV